MTRPPEPRLPSPRRGGTWTVVCGMLALLGLVGTWYFNLRGWDQNRREEAGMNDKQEPSTSTIHKGKTREGFTAEERAAMKERAKESKASAQKADWETDVLEKIAEMPTSDRVMAERIHAIIKAGAPGLSPKLWYGMPAYAKDGKVVCFFQSAEKFKSRYATLGFNDAANLDDGSMWPTAFALTKLTAADEAKIGELVKKAAT